VSRHGWLSITPEPELELPAAVAALRRTNPAQPAEPAASALGSVEAERARVEHIVLRGRRRDWSAYLSEAAALAAAAAPSEARDIVLDVIENHDNLRLGLE
jgi:hypothetical protein